MEQRRLFKALAQHRAFLGPTLRKGVHFFDLHPDQPLDWYRAHFPTRSAVESLQRSGDGRVVVGESSPYYLWHPLAAGRIARTLPSVRVIALLRDPVERAYSAHAHELARGFEAEPFEQALALEAQRLDGEEERLRSGEVTRSLAHQHQAYVQRGEYIDQLQRMEQAVGREQMLVLDSADFWSTPERDWPEVTAFLGLAAPRGCLRAPQRQVARPDERRPSRAAGCALRAVRRTTGAVVGSDAVVAAMSEQQPPNHLHRIGRGGSQNVVAAAVAAGLGIALSVVVARSFSEEDTGLYFAATSVVLLVATITRLGTSIGLVYWVARLRELGRAGELRALLRIALRPVLALSLLGAVALFAGAPIASDVLLDGSETGTQLLRVLALALPAIVIFDALLGATRGLGTMTPTAGSRSHRAASGPASAHRWRRTHGKHRGGHRGLGAALLRAWW